MDISGLVWKGGLWTTRLGHKASFLENQLINPIYKNKGGSSTTTDTDTHLLPGLALLHAEEEGVERAQHAHVPYIEYYVSRIVQKEVIASSAAVGCDLVPNRRYPLPLTPNPTHR